MAAKGYHLYASLQMDEDAAVHHLLLCSSTLGHLNALMLPFNLFIN